LKPGKEGVRGKGQKRGVRVKLFGNVERGRRLISGVEEEQNFRAASSRMRKSQEVYRNV